MAITVRASHIAGPAYRVNIDITDPDSSTLIHSHINVNSRLSPAKKLLTAPIIRSGAFKFHYRRSTLLVELPHHAAQDAAGQ